MIEGWTKRLLLLIIVVSGTILLNGCGSKRPPLEKFPSGSPVTRSAVIRTASSQVGKPYKYGGSSPETGYDCSGFTRWVYEQHGVTLPRRSSDQLHIGRKVGKGDLKEADLVFFDVNGKGALHVGIYMDEKTFIHSPSRGGRVRKDNFSDRYWQKSFLEGRGVLP